MSAPSRGDCFLWVSCDNVLTYLRWKTQVAQQQKYVLWDSHWRQSQIIRSTLRKDTKSKNHHIPTCMYEKGRQSTSLRSVIRWLLHYFGCSAGVFMRRKPKSRKPEKPDDSLMQKKEKSWFSSNDDDAFFFGEAGECCQLNAKIWKSTKTESKHSNISYKFSIKWTNPLER